MFRPEQPPAPGTSEAAAREPALLHRGVQQQQHRGQQAAAQEQGRPRALREADPTFT